jgi:hypothetical protein
MAHPNETLLRTPAEAWAHPTDQYVIDEFWA